MISGISLACHKSYILPVTLNSWSESCSHHVAAACGLDLLHQAVLGLGQQLNTRTIANHQSKKIYFVKVTDNFIEQADALKPLLVDIILDIELFEVWY